MIASPGFGLKVTLRIKRALGVGTPLRFTAVSRSSRLLEGHLDLAVVFLELLREELPEFFGGGARFPGGGETLELDGDRVLPLGNAAIETGHLQIGRDAMRNLGKKRRPVEAIFDQTIEHFGAVDDLVQLGGPLLRGGHFRFDLFAIRVRRR